MNEPSLFQEIPETDWKADCDILFPKAFKAIDLAWHGNPGIDRATHHAALQAYYSGRFYYRREHYLSAFMEATRAMNIAENFATPYVIPDPVQSTLKPVPETIQDKFTEWLLAIGIGLILLGDLGKLAVDLIRFLH